MTILKKKCIYNLKKYGILHHFYCFFFFQDSKLELLRRFTIGLCSGILGSVINIPFDVAKSRIQGPQPIPGQVKYRTCFATMTTVYKEEGYVNLDQLAYTAIPYSS